MSHARVVFSISAALALLSLSACGGSPAKSTDPAGPYWVEGVAFENASVTCQSKDPASCPEGVGMLAIHTTLGDGQCTAFLVTDQILMTNSHCVPEEIKKPGADCRKNLQMLFPETQDKKAEKVACAEVISASTITHNKSDADFLSKPDYAILKLARAVSRKPLSLARDGFPEGLKLTAYTVDPQSKTSIKGLLYPKTCDAVYETVLTPGFTHPNAMVGTFVGCEVIGGNSGSPAVDSQGRVRALVHGGIDKSVVNGEATKNKKPVGIFTNVACTDLPTALGGARASEKCAQGAISSEKWLEKKSLEIPMSAYEELFNGWILKAPAELGYKLTAQDTTSGDKRNILYTPEIQCINSLAKHGDELFVTLNLGYPVWAAGIEVSDNYKAIVAPKMIIEFRQEVLLNKKNFEKDGEVNAMISLKQGTEASGAETRALKKCDGSPSVLIGAN